MIRCLGGGSSGTEGSGWQASCSRGTPFARPSWPSRGLRERAAGGVSPSPTWSCNSRSGSSPIPDGRVAAQCGRTRDRQAPKPEASLARYPCRCAGRLVVPPRLVRAACTQVPASVHRDWASGSSSRGTSGTRRPLSRGAPVVRPSRTSGKEGVSCDADFARADPYKESVFSEFTTKVPSEDGGDHSVLG